MNTEAYWSKIPTMLLWPAWILLHRLWNMGGVLNIFIISFCILKICKRSGIIKFYDLIFMVVCFKILMMSTLFFPYCNSKIWDLGYLFALRLILKKLSERKHQRSITTSLHSRYNNPKI